jgi:hypothetical protein
LNFEPSMKLPDESMVSIGGQTLDSVRTYNGEEGWIASPDKPMPLITLTGGNLQGARIEAVALFPSELQRALPQWKSAVTSIDDRDVQVLEGSGPGTGSGEVVLRRGIRSPRPDRALFRISRGANSNSNRLLPIPGSDRCEDTLPLEDHLDRWGIDDRVDGCSRQRRNFPRKIFKARAGNDA